VRESRRAAAKRDPRAAQSGTRRTPEEERRRKEEMEVRKRQALELAVETFDALVSERGDSGKIWASVLKEAIKRRKPDFSESYYGFRTFGNLLEEAQTRGLLEFGRDENPAPMCTAAIMPRPARTMQRIRWHTLPPWKQQKRQTNLPPPKRTQPSRKHDAKVAAAANRQPKS